MFIYCFWLFRSLNTFHSRNSNAHNFLIGERKHQVHFLSNKMTNILVPKFFGFAKKIRFGFSAPPFSVGETFHVAFKKYQIKRKFTFSGKCQVYSISCVENILIFTREISNIFNALDEIYLVFTSKKVNTLYVSTTMRYRIDVDTMFFRRLVSAEHVLKSTTQGKCI